MNLSEPQSSRVTIESAKTRVFNSITQCIRDIEKTVSSTGLTMRDIGVDVEKYTTARESYIIELKLHI